MNCSIVIPVYRGAETLEMLVKRLAQVLPGLAQAYEVILVNDDSPDNAWEIIERLAQEYVWVRGIRLMRNYGQHNATLCGVRAARYEITVTMDDDLQHLPEEIHCLLAKLEKGYDVVYGAPRKLPQGLLRNWMTRTTKRLLAWVMKVPSVREISAFRAFRTHLRQAFVTFQSPTLTLENLTSGEGGVLLINDPALAERAEIIREKGTNRSRFFRGQVDKYTRVDIGSSYLPSDILAAFLYGQLEQRQRIQSHRKALWETYELALKDWAGKHDVRLPVIPAHTEQPYHMFYMLLPNLDLRQKFIMYLRERGIYSVFPTCRCISRTWDASLAASPAIAR